MRRQNQLQLTRRRAHQRGIGLIDGLVALALLAFGMLAMTRFQARLITQGSDAQARLVATQLADELLSLVVVDPANGACYTVPATGTCNNPAARAYTDDWVARAQATLNGMQVAATRDTSTNTLSVTLSWNARSGDDMNQLVVTSHAR